MIVDCGLIDIKRTGSHGPGDRARLTTKGRLAVWIPDDEAEELLALLRAGQEAS